MESRGSGAPITRRVERARQPRGVTFDETPTRAVVGCCRPSSGVTGCARAGGVRGGRSLGDRDEVAQGVGLGQRGERLGAIETGAVRGLEHRIGENGGDGALEPAAHVR